MRGDLKQAPGTMRAGFGDMGDADHQNSAGRIRFHIFAEVRTFTS